MKRLLALLAASALCGPAYAATAVGLPSLGAHGVPVASDLIPCQTASSATLQSCTAANVRDYVLTSVKSFGAVGDGTTDDTTSIQNAINSGLPIYFPPGVYKTTATLTVSTYASNGQILRGSGSYYGSASAGFSTTPPPGTAVIRPSSAVTKIFTIDGTPVLGAGTSYIQGWGLENIAIDMTNMTDLATSIAFYQVQAFDIHYNNVRVINDGNRKEGWNFQAGAYTTNLANSQANIVYFDGQSFANATTTISLSNCDIGAIYHDHFQNVTMFGGAIQRSYSSAVPVVYIPPGTTPYAYTTNSSGLYGFVLSEINTSAQFTSIGTDWEQGGGFPSTYNDGTHGTLTAVPVLMVDATATNTTFINPTFAGMYLLDYGINTRLIGQGLSGVTGFDLHNGTNYQVGIEYQTGALKGISGPGGESSPTFTLDSSAGSGGFQSVAIKPASNGNALTVANVAGTGLFQMNTATPAMNFNNGLVVSGYHDNASTLTWQLSDVSNAGKLVLYSGGAAQITLNSNGTIQGTQLYNTPVGLSAASTGAFTTLSASGTVSGAGFMAYLASPPAIGSTAAAAGFFTNLTISSTMNAAGVITAQKGVINTPATVSTLPATPLIGQTGFVTDATSCAFATTVTGGGSTKCPVVYNGSSWVAG